MKNMLNKNIKILKILYVLCSIIIITSTILIVIYYIPQCQTEELVKKEVNRIKDCGITGNVVSLDGWGNSIRYGICKETNVTIYTVCSAGRDGKFDTLDDIGGQKTKEK